MSDHVQPLEAPTVLLETSRRVVPGWLRRITVEACRRGGVDATPISAEIDALVEHAAADVLARLDELLATDVDEQRTTPLTLFREAVRAPSAFLEAHGATHRPAPPGTPGSADDPYGLGPATWSDIDPDLHEPGILWGAWKAMTVLARRRDSGLR